MTRYVPREDRSVDAFIWDGESFGELRKFVSLHSSALSVTPRESQPTVAKVASASSIWYLYPGSALTFSSSGRMKVFAAGSFLELYRLEEVSDG